MPNCFVIMSFNEKYDPVFYNAIREAARNKGYNCGRADSPHGNMDIPDSIIKSIINSDIIIADVSEPRANVYFELGIAYSVRKPTICISRTTRLPFDIRNYSIILYDPKNLNMLRLLIEEALTNISTFEDNPVIRSGKEYFALREKIEDNLRSAIRERQKAQDFLLFRLKGWTDNSLVANELIDVMTKRISFSKKDKLLVVISGSSSIGKSTFSNLLRDILLRRLGGKRTIEILPTDSYMMNRPHRLSKNITGYNTKAHDFHRLERDIVKLMKGENVVIKPYDHSTGFHLDEVVVKSADIIIMEGAHSFHPPVYKDIDYSIFIYGPRSVVKELRFLADYLYRNYSAEDAFEHSDREYIDYEDYVLPYYKMADTVIYVEGFWLYRLSNAKGRYTKRSEMKITGRVKGK